MYAQHPLVAKEWEKNKSVIMKSTREELLKSIKSVLLSAVPNGKVILFGSRARGDARKDSDWDLLIILDKPKIEASDFDRISYPLYELLGGMKVSSLVLNFIQPRNG